ncbi:unnamed protein product [Clonostachys solani]|uniref:Uncharacterized protein n=1 Tax=Clonostachys solani TaxID=160281 RepID=A0A9P0ESA1_9HYPO|nr:unnamed protein product [Clonostachys solani]
MGDLDSAEVIGFSELSSEVGSSEVYSPGEKQQMIRIIESTAKLCIIMTDLILLLYPSSLYVTSQSDKASTLGETETAFDQWYLECCAQISGHRQGIDRSPSEQWVQLHTSSMIATYHTTKVALYQYLAFKDSISSPVIKLPEEISWMHVNGKYHDQLQDAILSSTQKLVEISDHGMSQWIPAHLLVSTGTSLLVHILYAKTTDLEDYIIPLTTDEQAMKLRRRSLGSLIEMLDIADDHYNDVQYILEPLREFSRNSGVGMLLRKLLTRKEGAQKSSSWIKTTFADARDYIHLQTILEITLSEGNLPERSDLASSLKFANDNNTITPESSDNSDQSLLGLSQSSLLSDAEQNYQSTSSNTGALSTQGPSLSDDSPSPFVDWWFSGKNGTSSPLPSQSLIQPEPGIESLDDCSMHIPGEIPRIGSGLLDEVELKELFAESVSGKSSPY